MTVIVGAQYYRPPNPPREDWRRDLGRMRDAGLTNVKLWACWSWINLRDGEFDFADLDELVQLAADAELRVTINTIIENAPYWLEERLPQARYLDSEDRPVHLTSAMNTPGGGWPGLCFDHDAVWAAAQQFLEAVSGRYGSHPAVQVWDVWNEPHLEPASYFPERLYCYCPASLAWFREWLQARYTDLDALNAAWSRRYSDWSQVAPPRLFESVPDMIDWREFWFANLSRWLRQRVDCVRPHVGQATVMTHVALSGFTGELAKQTVDEFTLVDDVDLFGTSSFPTWLMGDDPVEHLFNLDTARAAAAGRPFWQAELQGGRGRRAGLNSTPQPGADVVRLWMWNALASGASGIVFWQWRPELLGPESPGYGLCAPDGTPTSRVAGVSAMAAVAAQPDMTGLRVEPARAGLILSRRSALHAFASDHHMELYRDAVMGSYRMFVDADIPVDLVHDDRLERDGVPDHVSTLYWPMPATASPGLCDVLTRFVERGCRLIAEAAPAEYDEHGRRRAVVPGGGLDRLFGLVEHETTVTPDQTIVFDDGSRLGASWQTESLRLGSAAAVGAFLDGSVAATANRFGAGSAELLASYPSLSYAQNRDAESLGTFARRLGDPGRTGVRWREPAPGLMTRHGWAGSGAPIVFALNWTRDDAILEVEPSCRVLFADAPATEHGPDESVMVPARAGAAVVAI